jgi:hypothetical protein
VQQLGHSESALKKETGTRKTVEGTSEQALAVHRRYLRLLTAPVQTRRLETRNELESLAQFPQRDVVQAAAKEHSEKILEA